MRPRKRNRELPPCVYFKHGAYWYVKRNTWTRLSDNLPEALQHYAKLAPQRSTGMPDLIDRAHPHIIRNVKPSTATQYARARDMLKKILQEFSPDQVKMRDVAEIKNHYAHIPNMANRVVSYLRQVFNMAVEWQLVDTNPCVGIRRFHEKKRDRYVTDDEFAKIREQGSDNLKAIIDICYLTGQRIGDVLSIHLSDVSDEGIFFKQQKTGARLMIAMTPDLKDAVERAKRLPRSVRGLTLFCTMRGGRPYAYGTVKDMFNRACEKAGIADVTLHDLRAKSLTDAKRQGKDAVKLGGHSDPKMTERYIRRHDTIVAEPPSFRHPVEILDNSKGK